MKRNIQNIFEEIYNNESDAIFRFCMIRVSDREQALDITQETFLRLWQNIAQNNEIKNNRAFLFTIAHHLVIDWYRKKKSISFKDMQDRNGDEDENSDYDPPDKDTTEKSFFGFEGRNLIEKINELSAIYKDPVYLRFVEDLSPGEIGKILGITSNAASVRINRGLAELREKTGYNKEI